MGTLLVLPVVPEVVVVAAVQGDAKNLLSQIFLVLCKKHSFIFHTHTKHMIFTASCKTPPEHVGDAVLPLSQASTGH